MIYIILFEDLTKFLIYQRGKVVDFNFILQQSEVDTPDMFCKNGKKFLIIKIGLKE